MHFETVSNISPIKNQVSCMHTFCLFIDRLLKSNEIVLKLISNCKKGQKVEKGLKNTVKKTMTLEKGLKGKAPMQQGLTQ